MKRGTIAAAVVVLGLAACGGRDDPKLFSERADLRSCGSIGAHRPGDAFTTAEQRLITCLTDAHDAGVGAELKLTLLDTEGGRSQMWVRVLAAGGVEEFQHTPDSEFGNEEWTLTTCTDLRLDQSGQPHGAKCAASIRL